MPAQQLYLVPPLIQEGRLAEYLAQGQTVSHSLSPRSNSLAVFSSPKEVGLTQNPSYPRSLSVCRMYRKQMPLRVQVLRTYTRQCALGLQQMKGGW